MNNLSTNNLVEAVARKYKKTNWYVDEDDLKQIARECILKCEKTFDSSKGNFINYCWISMKNAVSDFVVRSGVPVSTHKNNKTKLFGITKASITDDCFSIEGQLLPDDLLYVKELRNLIRNEVYKLAPKTIPAGFIYKILLGEIDPSKVSTENNLPIRKVYSSVASTKVKLKKSRQLKKLWEEIRNA